MKIPRGTPALVLAALVIAPIATAGPATTQAPIPGAPQSTPLTVEAPAPAVPAAHRPTARSSTVTLVTGDRVRLDVDTSGAQTASVLSPSGDAKPLGSTFTGFTWHGDEYVIPNVVAPYLSTIDPRLFDVSYLVRAQLDDAHSSTLPVKVTSSGASPAAVPGLVAAGGSGTATMAKAQSRQFGTQLADQWRASRAGTSSVPIGRLPGVNRIELAPAATAPALPAAPATPSGQTLTGGAGLPFHTLTINHVDQEGTPGAAIGFLQNVDHPEIGPWMVQDTGTITYSVPEGTYSLAAGIVDGPADDLTVKSALVVNPEFTVTADRTITLDARQAKPYQANVEPQVTDEPREDVLTFARIGVNGSGVKVQNAGLAAIRLVAMRLFSLPLIGSPVLSAAATQAVTKGTFDFSAGTGFTEDESLVSAKPKYYLLFPHPGGIPSALTYTVPRTEFAAMHHRIYSNPGTDAGNGIQLGYRAYLPWGQLRMPINGNEILEPGEHTDYVYSSSPKLVTWAPLLSSSTGRVFYGLHRTIANGQQISEEWNKGGLTPSAKAPYIERDSIGVGGGGPTEVSVSDPLATVCLACRQDDNGMLFLTPGDSDPAHLGSEWNARNTVDFYRNGELAETSDAAPVPELFVPFGLDVPLLPDAATYRLDWTTRPELEQGAFTETDWTFHSAATDAAASLPATGKCAPDTSRACSFLPLLFLRYDLALNTSAQARAGTSFDINFAVAHQENQAAPAGVGATVSVSYDDGATWTDAQPATSRGGNRFGVTITHPDLAATNGFVSLRVQAHDDAGNSVEQTTVHAYALTS
jgi:hypothetical protein